MLLRPLMLNHSHTANEIQLSTSREPQRGQFMLQVARRFSTDPGAHEDVDPLPLPLSLDLPLPLGSGRPPISFAIGAGFGGASRRTSGSARPKCPGGGPPGSGVPWNRRRSRHIQRSWNCSRHRVVLLCRFSRGGGPAGSTGVAVMDPGPGDALADLPFGGGGM